MEVSARSVCYHFLVRWGRGGTDLLGVSSSEGALQPLRGHRQANGLWVARVVQVVVVRVPRLLRHKSWPWLSRVHGLIATFGRQAQQ